MVSVDMEYIREWALEAVNAERQRQEDMKADGRFKFTCADPGAMTNAEKLTVLVEEVGEVARVLIEYDDPQLAGTTGSARLREELAQVAAVAVAWLEALWEPTA